MAWTTPRTWVTGEMVTASIMNTHVRDNFGAVAPVGSLSYQVRGGTAVATVVEGAWLECNGVAVSRTTYATLFNYLNGLTPALPFGNGDASTTFNLPDFRGRLPIAVASTGHVDVDALGDNDGSALASRRPKHKHTVVQPTITANINLRGATPGGAQASVTNAGNYSDDSTNTDDMVFSTASGGTVGPQTGEPTDTPAYLVGGVWIVKF